MFDPARFDDPATVLDELTRWEFPVFLRRAWPLISGGDELDWNWHLEAVAYQLDRVARGDCRRLLVNLPPRNGKSKTISVIWIAWMLGHDPTLNFVCVSYSNELSGKLARDCRALMETPHYRTLFPGTVISQRRSAAYDFETTRGGGRLATSVTGTLTGRGGDIIVLDDVIKPEDANSEAARNNLNDWFRSTLSSRLDDKSSGAILCVMQRLHEFDLPGMLLAAGGWDHLSIPAIAMRDERILLPRRRIYHRKEGCLLHPAREPMHVLQELKAAMGTHVFEAQYQQNPLPAVGNTFKKEWLREYDPDEHDFSRGQMILSLDTASKDNPHADFSVLMTAQVFQDRIYMCDILRKRLEMPELLKTTIAKAREYNAQVLLIEDQASGTQLIQTIRSQNPRGVPLPIGRRPETDKLSRALGVSPMVEAGQLYLPSEAPWLADLLSELLGFPNARYDDQVDALSQLLTWVRRRHRPYGRDPGAPMYF